MTREEALELCKAEFQEDFKEIFQDNVNLLNLARLQSFRPPEIIDVKSEIDKVTEECFRQHEQFASSCNTADSRAVEAYLKRRIEAIKGMIFLTSLIKAAAYFQKL